MILVEIKRGKFIEGSCKNLWSNKEHRAVKGLNIVSLNYSDCLYGYDVGFFYKL